MRLERGTRLGAYEILEPVGAGGMGEVYKARDTRLDRIVAVKVLSEQLAESAERKLRFEREAKAISQLNHPHICTLFDVGSQDGIEYLVMEFIEGETLAERLMKGPLPLDEVLEYGAQIADGLETAHRAGIVHRDLKPANTMLTTGGVKLLDFGLARLMSDDAVSDASDAPTRQQNLTKEQSIIGTLQYMAPEQLEGKSPDHRADMWALGALIYEMVSGAKAFRGQSQASLIAAILGQKPEPISSLQPITPAALERLVERCLAKNPEDRWQSARDIALELRWMGQHDEAVAVALSTPRRRRPWVVGLVGVAVGLSIAAMLLGSFGGDEVAPSAGVSRLLLSPQPAGEFGDRAPSQVQDFLTRTSIAFSSDGSGLVFVGRRDSRQQLYFRSLDQYDAQPLPDTEGASNPFVEPSGEWIGFWADGWIKKVPLRGGSAVNVVATERPPMGAVWTARDTIVYAESGGYRGLSEVPASGGDVRHLTTLSPQEASHRLPSVLTDYEVLFTVKQHAVGAWDATRIEMVSLDDGVRQTLLDGGADARYVASGHLVYVDAGSLLAVGFDADRLELVGEPVTFLDGVSQSISFAYSGSDSGAGQFAISSTGTLAYIPGSVHRIAMHAYTNNYVQVWVYDIPRNTLSILSADPGGTPRWTPDGNELVYTSAPAGGSSQLMVRSADGSGEANHLAGPEWHFQPGSWTPDGQQLAYTVEFGRSDKDIGVLQRRNAGELGLILASPAEERQPSFSPDGLWLAYVSDASGIDEVYVQPFPGPGERLQISSAGGVEPVWSRDGAELFYRSLDPRQVMVVDVQAGEQLVASRARPLFEDRYIRSSSGSMDVAPDGRFLMLRQELVERAELY